MSGFGDRVNQRQKSYKKAANADDSRRKREDVTVQLRKHTRDEALQKKRQLSEALPDSMSDEMMDGFTAESLADLEQQLTSDDYEEQYDAAVKIRILLSTQTQAPIQEIIELGVVPRLIQLMRANDWPEMQEEAIWSISNIASGTTEQTATVVQAGALEPLIEAVESIHESVCQQAVWALGNIAGDSVHFRDLVLQSGALNTVVELLLYCQNTSILQTAAWTLSNLCRGKPSAPLQCAQRALDALTVLTFSEDEDVLTHVCWAVAYLTDATSEYLDAVIGSDVVGQLIELLLHSSTSVQIPALRAIGNLVVGDETQTDTILQGGALPPLSYLLSHPDKQLRKDACWALSNVCAGTTSQIQELVDCGVIPQLVSLLQTGDFDIRKEALWAVSNITLKGSPEQIDDLIVSDCIEPLVDVLTTSDTQALNVALEAINNILQLGLQRQTEQGSADNAFALMVEQVDGLSKLEALQEGPSEEIYQKVVHILENYFVLEDENGIDDEGMEGTSDFQFGATPPPGGFVFA